MAYATLADVRAEGVTTSDASDARVNALLSEAAYLFDRITGSWFEARVTTITLDGTGTPQLWLEVPIVSVSEVRYHDRVNATSEVVPAAYYRASTKVDNPKLTYLYGRWARGVDVYEVDGTFGWLEGGATPAAIRRATLLYVVHWAGETNDDYEASRRRQGDLKSKTVQGRSETYGGMDSANGWTGIAEVDRILALYRAPMGMEAA